MSPVPDDPALPGLLVALAEGGYTVRFRFAHGEWAAECEEPHKLTWGVTKYAATVAMLLALGYSLE